MPIDIRATHNVLGHDYAPVYTDQDINYGRTWTPTMCDKETGANAIT